MRAVSRTPAALHLFLTRPPPLSPLPRGRIQETASEDPYLNGVFAREITHTGAAGTGQAAKLAHQLVFGLNVMALLEGLSLGVAGGVDATVMKAVLQQGLANSGVLEAWPDLGPRWKGMLETSAAGAALPNLRKDLHLVLEFARELGVSLPIATLGSEVADAGLATGHRDPRL